MKNKSKSLAFLLLRLIISLGLLGYLFYRTDWEQILSLWQRVSLKYYLLALICVVIFQTLVAYRWKQICKIWDFHQPFFFFWKSYLLSISLNNVFPGIVAGDTLRGGLLVKHGLNWKKASMSLLFDRGYGFLGILFILSISLPFYGSFLPSKFYYFLFFSAYFAIFLFLLTSFTGSFFLRRSEKMEIFKPLFYPYNLKPFCLGILIQTFFVLQYVFLSKSLSLTIPFRLYFVIIPVISFLSALPLSISGLGVREGTLSYFLSLLGYPISYGLVLGFLGYSLILLSALPGIILYLTKKWN